MKDLIRDMIKGKTFRTVIKAPKLVYRNNVIYNCWIETYTSSKVEGNFYTANVIADYGIGSEIITVVGSGGYTRAQTKTRARRIAKALGFTVCTMTQLNR